MPNSTESALAEPRESVHVTWRIGRQLDNYKMVRCYLWRQEQSGMGAETFLLHPQGKETKEETKTGTELCT